MITYSLYLSDPLGNRLRPLSNFERLTWVRTVNDIGFLRVRFAIENFDPALWKVDRRLELSRVADGRRQNIGVYFLRYRARKWDENGRFITIGGPDSNDLLLRRIIDADAGSAGATKSGTADDVMKEYVDEQLGGSAAAGRDITDYGFSIQDDLSLGPSVGKDAARRNLLLVLQEIAADAAEQGTRVFFDVVNPTFATFQFQTFVGQRGHDRTLPGGFKPPLLSAKHLQNPEYIEDWEDEINYVYAAGRGEKEDREVEELSDDDRVALSVFGRREGLFDGRNYSTTAGLQSAGRKRLRDGRPARIFPSTLLDRDGSRFGREWSFGDKVTVSFEGDTYDLEVATVSAAYREGEEILTGQMSYVD